MTGIALDHVTVSYPGADFPALDGIDLTIPAGAFVSLIGANNAGKSTLCSAMAGLLPGTIPGRLSGKIRIQGAEVSTLSPRRRAGLVGMVLQVPHHQMSGIRYTVFEEAALALEYLGKDRRKIIERVESALAVTGLTAVSDHSPFRLSGGQQQRLAIAGILALDPDVLVLDEPTTLLDPGATEQVYQVLRRLHRKGKTIVVAEHRLEKVAEHAEKVVVLVGGKKEMEGDPETVLTRNRIREIGLDWTRYTETARLAKACGIWPEARPLPASLQSAVEGLLP